MIESPSAAMIGTVLPSVELTLTPTTTALQVSGSQDWHRIHHDPEQARSAGHQDVFYNTAWTQGLLCRVVQEWIGDRPWWLTELNFTMRQMNGPGDVVRACGVVTDVGVEVDGLPAITLDVWLENDRVGRTTPGTAIVRIAVHG